MNERKRPAPSRREIEISKVIKEALEPAIMLEKFPRTAVDVFIEVLQADGGTRCAALTAASVALADAGIPMRDMVAAIASGKVADTIILMLTMKKIKQVKQICQLDICHVLRKLHYYN